jgi:hypothetical protein
MPATSVSATAKVIALIESLAKFGYALGLSLAVLYLIILGFKYIKGGGKDVSQTHHEIILLLVGVILIIISFAIPTLIRSFIER